MKNQTTIETDLYGKFDLNYYQQEARRLRAEYLKELFCKLKSKISSLFTAKSATTVIHHNNAIQH